MYFPPAETAKPKIDAAIAEVINLMAPHVLNIRYDFGQDWTGEWTIFFRVLLSDKVAKRKKRSEVAMRVISERSDPVIPELWLIPHFHFRSQSEQAEINDPAWA